jgi:hypothetical protein
MGCLYERLEQVRVPQDRVALAHRRHQAQQHRTAWSYGAVEHVAQYRRRHEPDADGNAGAGKERDRSEHDKAAHPFWTVECAPDRPGAAPRRAGEHGRVQPELV